MSPFPRARVLRHPAVVAVAVLAVGATAFLSYGAWTRYGDVRYARGGAGGTEVLEAVPALPPSPGAVPAAAAPTAAPADRKPVLRVN